MKIQVILAAIFATASSLAVADNGRATSPNNMLMAMILPNGPGAEDGTGSEKIVISNRGNSRELTLIVSKYDEDFRLNLTSLSNPLFSLDGGYLYFSSTDASPNTGAVHQINLRTRAHKFVVAGTALRILRTGPYRGYLLVQQHRYYDRPQGGSYNPVYVIRPDGRTMFMVPGSANDDGDLAIDPWLARMGWRAW